MSSRKFSILDFDKRHFVRVEDYAAQIEKLYQLALIEATKIAVELKIRPEREFSFSDYPATSERVRAMLTKLAAGIIITIQNAQTAQWLFSNQKNDALVGSILGSSLLTKPAVSRYMSRNLEALTAFQQRKIAGLGLSDRVFKYVAQFRTEIELGLDVGLGEGRSAQQISRDLRSYLNEPDKLFRRVRTKQGSLALSKAGAAYHPGTGVYRSSYKNAMRLTRSEINQAYQTADYTRWQQLDFVVGIRVERSNNITTCDVCPYLTGVYPKDFLFRGFHPACRCRAIPILATREELSVINRQILTDVTPASFVSVNAVQQPNKGFTEWVQRNRDKLNRAKNKPYFIQDNAKYVR